jgi:hypothetical protein
MLSYTAFKKIPSIDLDVVFQQVTATERVTAGVTAAEGSEDRDWQACNNLSAH